MGRIWSSCPSVWSSSSLCPWLLWRCRYWKVQTCYFIDFSQFGFVWCFLMIRFRLYIFGRNLTETMLKSVGWCRISILVMITQIAPLRRLLQRFSTVKLLFFLLQLISISSGNMFSPVQFSHSIVSNSLPPQSQHARPPCPSPTPGVHSDSHPSSQWCHPAISSSVIPFSSCPQSLPASQSFPMSQLFAWCGQSTGVSALASFLPKKSQDWSPSEWTGWISLQSKGLSRVFSNTTAQKHQFSVLILLYSPTLTSIYDHWKNHSLE